MKILIICTYFPPDNIIATVRPSMFAKYLSKKGHEVTVLRSGEIAGLADESNIPESSYELFSYLGPESDAERFKRGETISIKYNNDSRIKFLPPQIRYVVSKIFHIIIKPYTLLKKYKAVLRKYRYGRKAILELCNNKKFDIVFSTYGPLESALLGKFAKKVFCTKWICDFRDPIANSISQGLIEYRFSKWIQKKLVMKADIVTTVSDGAKKQLLKETGKKDIITLYNGYDEETDYPLIYNDKPEITNNNKPCLKICYTGQIYSLRSEAFEEIIKALAELCDEKKISESNIEITYAGAGSNEIMEILKKYKLLSTLNDLGYIDKHTVEKVQSESDIFLVLSWNTKSSQGILTGKFYEGIRFKKQILAVVVGELPNSELKELNEKYKYGFCHEKVDSLSFQKLKDYLVEIYNIKMNNNKIIVDNKKLQTRFNYINITDELEKLME